MPEDILSAPERTLAPQQLLKFIAVSVINKLDLSEKEGASNVGRYIKNMESPSLPQSMLLIPVLVCSHL